MHNGRRWSSLSYQADQLLNDMSLFWSTNREALQNALAHSDMLYTQIGDLNGMSRHYLSATIRLGLYFDTICLLDPFSMMAQRRESMEDHFLTGRNDDPELIRILLSYLEVRSLERLILSDTQSPIAVVIPPGGFLWGDATFECVHQIATSNTFSLFSDAFKRQIESRRDILSIWQDKSLCELEEVFRNHTVLSSLFEEVGFGSLAQMVELSRYSTTLPYSSQGTLPPKALEVAHIFGTLNGVMLALEGAEASAATMHIDFSIPKSLWLFDRFRRRCNAKLSTTVGLRQEIAVQAAILSEKMDWMAAAKIDDLIEMRESGLMEQVRNIYRIKRRELQKVSPENFESAVASIADEVITTLRECVKEIETQKRGNLPTWGIRSGKFILTGALGIASAFFPILGLAGLLVPGASISDLARNHIEDKKRQSELAGRPVMHMVGIWRRTHDG